MFEDQKFVLFPKENNTVDIDHLQDLLAEHGAVVFRASQDDLDFTENQNVFYVMSDDDVKSVDEFVKRGARVISLRYALESIEKRMPVPLKDHPLYSSCLENVNVALDTSLDEAERSEMEKLIRYMSGTISDEVSDDTHVLIASAVGSLHYKVALEYGTPVVVPEWINQCWDQRKNVDKDQYKIKPFSGCIIAVTGLASPTRLEIKRLVEAYGGAYTPDLTRSCTHLLSKEPDGLKYYYAVQWGIHCVTPDWFFDSINEECCKDERLYLLPIVSRRSIFSPRSRGDLGRMSPKLRSNHVSQIKRNGSGSIAGIGRPRAPMNVVFIDQKKKILPPQILQSRINLQGQASPQRKLQKPKYSISNTSITREEVTKLIQLCDETIEHYTELAKHNNISEKLSELQSKTD